MTLLSRRATHAGAAFALAFAGGSVLLLIHTPVSATSPGTLRLPQTTPLHAQQSGKRFVDVGELEKRGDIDGLTALVFASREQGESAADLRVRSSAIAALANLGGDRPERVLETVVADAALDLTLRLEAIAALGRHGREPVIAFLKEHVTREPQKLVRERIRAVLAARCP